MEITNQTLHEILVRVEEKVTKTNGRVTYLEGWKNKITGALIIMNLILLPILYTIITNPQEDKMLYVIVILALIYLLLEQTNLIDIIKGKKARRKK